MTVGCALVRRDAGKGSVGGGGGAGWGWVEMQSQKTTRASATCVRADLCTSLSGLLKQSHCAGCVALMAGGHSHLPGGCGLPEL
jgi:hypothetical protein